MTQVVFNQLSSFAVIGASVIMFGFLCLFYKVGEWIMRKADKRGTFWGVILVLLAFAFSPMSVFAMTIRWKSLIRKTVLAVFVLLALAWGFSFVAIARKFIVF